MESFCDEELQKLAKLARMYARRFQPPAENVQDCGQQFIEYLLKRSPEEQAAIRARPNRYAHNFAVDYLRHYRAGQKCLEQLKQEAQQTP
ncbi:hypothetical protein [Chthonomonas calidirosea]|uniref:hypothetical protein n=1 Tax=Chthonomonas calidirosea TaxID=454171 RepID=UPI0006ECA22C|nr:hypothetical protein [Chthonomonas calidirosea]CEK16523.1 hypothetical protein CP488_01535 [Chthonomonas calidirosea]